MIKEHLLRELNKAPLALLAIKDKEIISHYNNLLPYSTGFEIECSKSSVFDLANFEAIPDIMEINIDGSEQRFRIPNGIRGLICLYHISCQLKINSTLNPGSGIHYHVDSTDCFSRIQDILPNNSRWILKELDEWEYPGNYNKRAVSTSGDHSWVRCNSLRTIEFRLGEMTFDYEVLFKRVVHCNSIIKRLKDELEIPPPEFQPVDANRIIQYAKGTMIGTAFLQGKINRFNDMLKSLEKEAEPEPTIEEIQPMVRRRIHKINPNGAK